MSFGRFVYRAVTGLRHVVWRRAWLTVLDGYRPGRQLILIEHVTILGRGDHLPLPFLGYSGRNLESEHARVIRHRDGSYTVEDNQTEVGTRLNGETVTKPAVLRDGDVIRLGSNMVRFNWRRRAPAPPHSQAPKIPPPPPPPR